MSRLGFRPVSPSFVSFAPRTIEGQGASAGHAEVDQRLAVVRHGGDVRDQRAGAELGGDLTHSLDAVGERLDGRFHIRPCR